MKSKVGIELEKLDLAGVLERHGFKDAVFTKGGKEIRVKGIKSFFKFVKEPYRSKPGKVKDVIAEGDVDKLVKLQSKIEKLLDKEEFLTNVQKKSIDDSFINLEETINESITGQIFDMELLLVYMPLEFMLDNTAFNPVDSNVEINGLLGPTNSNETITIYVNNTIASGTVTTLLLPSLP